MTVHLKRPSHVDSAVSLAQHRARQRETALRGTYHAFSFRKYAARYLSEMQYRFNWRFPMAGTWALRLKRVLNIDILACPACGSAIKVIACIEDSVVITKIPDDLKDKAAPDPLSLLPSARAPPAGLFG